MRLNNKGMAVSGILYTLLVLFIALIFGILGLISSSKTTYDKLKHSVGDRLNGIEEPAIRAVAYKASTTSIMVVVAPLTEEQKVENYYYSVDGVNYVKHNAPTYSFSGLDKNKTYEVHVKLEDKKGLQSNEVIKDVSTKEIANPTIKQTSQTPASGFDYATERKIQITYISTNLEKPSYYFKSTAAATVESGVVTDACGTEEEPGACTKSTVTTLTKNTWYKTSTLKPTLTYKAIGKLYALTIDDVTVSGTSTYSISKIDRTKPTVAATVDKANVSLLLKDNKGVIGYKVTTSSTVPTSWDSITSTVETTKTYTGTGPGTYYAHVIDVAGNTQKTSFVLEQSSFSYAATVSTSTYAATYSEHCNGSCTITSVYNYNGCMNAGGGTSTDGRYHSGSCANGQVKNNSIC